MHPGTPNVEKKLRAVSNPKSRAGFQLGGHPGYEDVPTSGTGPPNASNCEASCLAVLAADPARQDASQLLALGGPVPDVGTSS